MGSENNLINSIKPSEVSDKQTIVLRTRLLPQDMMEILEKKKTSLFGSALRRPRTDEITVDTPKLFFEQVIFVLGHYSIDFNRQVSYMIKVDPDVKEVTIGKEKFPVLDKTGMWKNFGKKMKQGIGLTKQDLKIKVTENAIKNVTDSFYLDNHGLETVFSHSVSSDAIENYAQKVLDLHKGYVRKINLSDDDVFSRLAEKLRDELQSDVKINHEEYIISEFKEIFIPVYETECYDKKNKVAVARIDAITGKFL